MILIFTAEADADLERIGDHIALASPRRALSFIQDLRIRAEHLVHAPEAYPLLAGYEDTGVR